MISLSFPILLYLGRKYPDCHPFHVVVWVLIAVVTGAYEGVL